MLKPPAPLPPPSPARLAAADAHAARLCVGGGLGGVPGGRAVGVWLQAWLVRSAAHGTCEAGTHEHAATPIVAHSSVLQASGMAPKQAEGRAKVVSKRGCAEPAELCVCSAHWCYVSTRANHHSLPLPSPPVRIVQRQQQKESSKEKSKIHTQLGKVRGAFLCARAAAPRPPAYAFVSPARLCSLPPSFLGAGRRSKRSWRRRATTTPTRLPSPTGGSAVLPPPPVGAARARARATPRWRSPSGVAFEQPALCAHTFESILCCERCKHAVSVQSMAVADCLRVPAATHRP